MTEPLVASVNALRTECASRQGYPTRTANLCNTLLKIEGSETTGFDDGVRDVLTGSAGQDWLFANLDSGLKDKITDLGTNEFADDLDFINKL